MWPVVTMATHTLPPITKNRLTQKLTLNKTLHQGTLLWPSRLLKINMTFMETFIPNFFFIEVTGSVEISIDLPEILSWKCSIWMLATLHTQLVILVLSLTICFFFLTVCYPNQLHSYSTAILPKAPVAIEPTHVPHSAASLVNTPSPKITHTHTHTHTHTWTYLGSATLADWDSIFSKWYSTYTQIRENNKPQQKQVNLLIKYQTQKQNNNKWTKTNKQKHS